jgi:uncharacterized membrane protein YgcG
MHYSALHQAELVFRLAQLQRRYPGYVTQSMANGFAASGGDFNWQQHPDFLAQMQAGTQAARTSVGASSSGLSFGGGGRSAGGGGGSW